MNETEDKEVKSILTRPEVITPVKVSLSIRPNNSKPWVQQGEPCQQAQKQEQQRAQRQQPQQAPQERQQGCR